MAQLEPVSRLEEVLRSGRPAVTAELNPPDSADPASVPERASAIASVCDAINATDAAGASVHMSSVAVSTLLVRQGLDPVMQLSCRDRNRIAVQGDLLGAAALGIRNVLCLTGDGVQTGDHPEARPVFDLDAITLLKTARNPARRQCIPLGSQARERSPSVSWGGRKSVRAAASISGLCRLGKKIEAGAQFIQTQYCYDVPRLRSYMDQVRDMGLHELAYILVGVGPLRSARSAQWMRSNVPGVVIPDEIIARLKGVPPGGGNQGREGKRICVEIIQEVMEIEGVRGVHIMAYRQEHLVPEIVSESGLAARRVDTSTGSPE